MEETLDSSTPSPHCSPDAISYEIEIRLAADVRNNFYSDNFCGDVAGLNLVDTHRVEALLARLTDGSLLKAIWTDTSQRLVIVQRGGFAGIEKVYDYSRDTLTAQAVIQLEQIKPSTSLSDCDPDAFTYEATVTERSGASTVYVSNNVCGDAPTASLISVEELEKVVSFLSSAVHTPLDIAAAEPIWRVIAKRLRFFSATAGRAG